MLSEPDKIKHLLHRAAYGYSPEYWNKDQTVNHVLQQLFEDAVSYNSIELISAQQLEAWKEQKNTDPGQFKKVVTTVFKDNTKELNSRWMSEMIKSPGVLREKMAMFWHTNLTVRVVNPYFNQQYVEVIRKHALGDFGTLLRAVSKTPAMLNFLNNQQNKKDHPNENFAREVMELFTLGRGNYTENDVQEAARAFTGWGFDLSGNFKFRTQQHDPGQKTILGKTGNFNGDDVLNIILEKKQCAYFITKKIFKYFVHEEADESIVSSLSEKFYQSHYDISGLLKTIFSSDWFYDQKNIGAKIKSPNDLLVGMFRTIPVQFENDQALTFLQKMLGQVLLFPPNVAGWPGGRSWIDSSTLLTRMRLPQVIYYDKELHMQPKEEILEMGEGKMAMAGNYIKNLASKKLGATANWNSLLEAAPEGNNLELAFSAKIIDRSIVPANLALLKKYTDTSSQENRVKSTVINLMSLPEYQLC
jgi:uncharacterized protein (DUF1800 family)